MGFAALNPSYKLLIPVPAPVAVRFCALLPVQIERGNLEPM